MNTAAAASTLSALAHQARLDIFRTLLHHGELPAGKLAIELGIPSSTLSFHLKDLRIAGLIVSRRQGRHLLYRADQERLAGLMAFLTAF